MKTSSPQRSNLLARAVHIAVISTTVTLIGNFPALAQPLTLQDCIDLALSQSLQHRKNHNNLERARSDLQGAQAPFEINANAGMTLDDPLLASRVRNEGIDFSYAGSLNLAQRVPYVGQFALETSATRQELTSNRREGWSWLLHSGQLKSTPFWLWNRVTELHGRFYPQAHCIIDGIQ